MNPDVHSFSAPSLAVLAQTAQALSDPSRLTILHGLRNGSRCVCELQRLLGLAQPTVSKHLKVLERAGLVRGEKRGQWVHYRITPPDAAEARELLAAAMNWLARCPEGPAIDGALTDAAREVLTNEDCSPCAATPLRSIPKPKAPRS